MTSFSIICRISCEIADRSLILRLHLPRPVLPFLCLIYNVACKPFQVVMCWFCTFWLKPKGLGFSLVSRFRCRAMEGYTMMLGGFTMSESAPWKIQLEDLQWFIASSRICTICFVGYLPAYQRRSIVSSIFHWWLPDSIKLFFSGGVVFFWTQNAVVVKLTQREFWILLTAIFLFQQWHHSVLQI